MALQAPVWSNINEVDPFSSSPYGGSGPEYGQDEDECGTILVSNKVHITLFINFFLISISTMMYMYLCVYVCMYVWNRLMSRRKYQKKEQA